MLYEVITELRLGAAHEPGPPEAAAAHGDFRLDDVITRAEGIVFRIEKGKDALFLVRLEQKPAAAASQASQAGKNDCASVMPVLYSCLTT